MVGAPCTVVPPCGDGVLGAGEICDDGNSVGGDGCAADCGVVESGWRCVIPGRRCLPICGDAGAELGGTACGASPCGDGIVAGAEECDDGAANDDSLYGGCTTLCTYGGYCGDGVVNGPEACDLGMASNVGIYGEPSGCTAGCVAAHFCGDGLIDPQFEQCDAGKNNGTIGSPCLDNCHIVLK